MKKSFVTITMLLFILTNISLAQSLRVGPAVGLHIPQDISILGSDDINYDFSLNNDMHYGLKAKLGLPGINLAAHLLMFDIGGDNNLEQDILSLGIGTEMKLVPGPLNFYLAGDLLITSFDEGTINVAHISNKFEEGKTRYGLAVGAGIDTSLFPFADLDLSVKYFMHNLIGKDDGEESLNTLNVTASFLFNLL